jgi:nucleotide-binding universal stress UspA family protein
MPTLKTLLCAVDFSESSPRVADYAATLATATKAEIVCLYVAPSLAEYVGFNVPQASLDSFVDDVVSSAEQSMTEFTSSHFKGLSVRGLVLAGYPAEEILRAAEKHHADIIVMGTHGRTGIDRIIFGSVAEKVVTSAPCPVLTVKPGPSAA